jgi:hypothetical protein
MPEAAPTLTTFELLDVILRAHDLLHLGKAEEAHEVLHGVCLDMEPMQAGTPRRLDFDAAFRTACRKNRVEAGYLLVLPAPLPGQPHRVALHSGGAQRASKLIDTLVIEGMKRHG